MFPRVTLVNVTARLWYDPVVFLLKSRLGKSYFFGENLTFIDLNYYHRIGLQTCVRANVSASLINQTNQTKCFQD